MPATPGSGAVDGFLTADGSYDSHAVTLADGTTNKRPVAGTPYRRITWEQIGQLVAVPAATPKHRAPLVVLSTYVEQDGRTHSVQRERGVYGGLAVDIDSGNPSLEQVTDAVRDAVGDVAAYVYSSSSAEPERRKWRVLLPLAGAIAGADYHDTQTALFELLEARGLVCDHSLARSAQPIYLPNVPPKRREQGRPDGRPLFYVGQVLEGPRLELVPGSPVLAARDALRQRRADEEAAAAARAEENRQRREAKLKAGGTVFEPIRHFNEKHSVREMLQRYGFSSKETRRGTQWKSPHSTSGSYSTEDRGDHWITVSDWARRHKIGREAASGFWYGTAFDLYAGFEFNGDRSAAVRAYAEQVRPGTTSDWEQVAAAPVRIETYETPADPVPLDEWRRELEAAVALEAERPGLKLLRGAPGTGKTYAVARAMAGRSGGLEQKPAGVVSVPGHEFAAELVGELQALGLDAAAYPKLDERTCRNWEHAEYAQEAGLPVTATICGSCPFKRECREDGYLALVKVAEQAPHKVCTHERLARQAGRLTETAAYVTIEEDPSKLLRPSISTTARQLERFAGLADDLAEAVERSLILDGLEPVPAVPAPVEQFDEFAAWAPDGEADAGDGGGGLTFDVRPSFFHRLCGVAEQLAGKCREAIRNGTPAGVHELELPQVVDAPKNPEGAVWHALDRLRRGTPGGWPTIPRDALTLALYAATGRLERLYLQVDEDTRPGRPASRIVHVVAFWRTSLPWDRMPVWVNDGTIEQETLEQLTGEQVVDVTPAGAVALVQPAEQYPVEILPTTSTAKVGRILAGIVRAHPERQRIGLVMLKKHRDELLFPADGVPRLPADVLERISFSTYYGAGADRGSNEFHRRADLVVVLGTFRPPPCEIRRALIRRGQLEAANATGTWGKVERRATGADGGIVTYAGRGYAERQWADAADGLTRAAVRQAVGRARAICADGVGVVLCSTENAGLPVRPAEALPVLDDRAEQVLQAVARISESVSENAPAGAPRGPSNCAQKPYKTLIGKMGAVEPWGGVTLEQLVEALPAVPYATLRKWVARAVEAGELVREGSTTATRYRLPLPAATVPRPVPPPPIVAETAGEPAWLAEELAPARHPVTLSDVQWLYEHACQTLEAWPAWHEQVTPPLVLHLHRRAVEAADARGQPPPPIEIVARHTVAWHAVTIGAA